MWLIIGSPLYCPDKVEKSVGMNIKLRLAEEEELEEGAAGGPTLEFVFEKDGVLLKEEEDLKGRRQQQFCAQTPETDRTEPCSAGSSQTADSGTGTDTNP